MCAKAANVGSWPKLVVGAIYEAVLVFVAQ